MEQCRVAIIWLTVVKPKKFKEDWVWDSLNFTNGAHVQIFTRDDVDTAGAYKCILQFC